MIGTTKQNSSPTQTPAVKQSAKGTTYDLCKKVKQEDGTEKLQRIGNVFIRASGTGGVAFITEADGTKYELPIFAKSKRPQGPKQDAAPQPEQVSAAAA